jgi:RHS repeat-associated protein
VSALHFSRGERVAGQDRYFVTDHLGTVRAVTDNSAQRTANYDIAPFGERSAASGSVEITRGFAGTEKHESSGLALAIARVYEPRAGIWLSEDPFQSDAKLDRSRIQMAKWGAYRYVRNNPVRWVDPAGLVTWDCEYSLAGAAEGFAAGFFIALCKSECVGGKQVTANYLGSAVGVGAGPVPVQAVFSSIEVTDASSVPDAHNLQGMLTIASAGFAAGVGVSYTKITMGSGTGKGGIGIQYGIDGGVTALVGAVAPLDIYTNNCCK